MTEHIQITSCDDVHITLFTDMIEVVNYKLIH